MTTSLRPTAAEAFTVRGLASVRQAALFHGVATEDIEALITRIDTVTITRRGVIFTQGQPGKYLYFVISGTVKLARVDADGRQQLTALVTSGEQFGELSVFDPGPRTATATAVTDTLLARAPASAVREWAGERPYVAARLLHVLARRLRRSNDLMCDLVFVDVPGRLARQLLQLAEQFGTHISARAIHVDHQLSQDELAQLIGCSRETVNKALARFQDRGWIQAVLHKSLVITDTDALTRRARR